MTERTGRAAAGALAVALLSGCTAPQDGPDAGGPTGSLPQRSAHTLPAAPGQGLDVPPPPPPVRWAGEGDRLVVVTHGSSSCPTAPTDVDVVGDQELQLEIGLLHPERDPCTADMAPRATEIDLPHGISADEPVTVHVHREGADVETVVLPPAGG